MSDIIKIDKAYTEWISDVSKRFRQCQVKAAMKVNEEMLRFFWALGKDMGEKKGAYAWGSKFYSRVSKDLTDMLLEVRSFSPRNLQYMNQFFRLFPNASDVKKTVSQLEASEITHQVDVQMGYGIVFCIPWGHIEVSI